MEHKIRNMAVKITFPYLKENCVKIISNLSQFVKYLDQNHNSLNQTSWIVYVKTRIVQIYIYREPLIIMSPKLCFAVTISNNK